MVGQIFMTLAFKESEATVLAPFKYMELVFALGLAYILYGESYSLLPILGITVIIAGVLLNVMFKRSSNH